MRLSMSFRKGGYPLEIGALGLTLREVVPLSRMFVPDTGERVARSRHRSPSRSQFPHLGFLSSHFFLRDTQVRQPVFDLSVAGAGAIAHQCGACGGIQTRRMCEWDVGSHLLLQSHKQIWCLARTAKRPKKISLDDPPGTS